MRANPEISQPEKGYRFSVDPFLLADFVEQGNPERLVDFGTGNGILTALLRKIFPSARFVGVDIRYSPLTHANVNSSETLFLQADVRPQANPLKPGSFDVAVSNPPFRKKGSGRLPATCEQAVARHEIKLTLEELCRTASHALREGGSFYMCHLPSRSGEVEDVLKKTGFAIKTVRYIFGRPGRAPFLFLVSGIKSGRCEPRTIPPLTVFDSGGDYTVEMKRIYEKLKLDG
jgi:tRNA1Val (adenine37-N6)-methyltransferase